MRFTLPRQRPGAEFASTLRIGNGDRASATDLLGLRCGAIYRANRMQPPSFQRKHGCKNTRIHRTLADRQGHYRVLRFRPCVAGSVCCLGKFELASPARDNTLVLPVQNPLLLHGMAAIETSRGISVQNGKHSGASRHRQRVIPSPMYFGSGIGSSAAKEQIPYDHLSLCKSVAAKALRVIATR